MPNTSGALALEPRFPVPLPPAPAVLALSERDGKKVLLPSLLPGIRVSRPHHFATLCLEKIGQVDSVPYPTNFQGEELTDDVAWFNQK